MKKIILLFLFCILLTGCWNYRELNDLAIVSGIGIDKDEDGYVVSFLISNAENIVIEDNTIAEPVLMTGRGKNIIEAISEIDSHCPNEIYMGHISVLVVD